MENDTAKSDCIKCIRVKLDILTFTNTMPVLISSELSAIAYTVDSHSYDAFQEILMKPFD